MYFKSIQIQYNLINLYKLIIEFWKIKKLISQNFEKIKKLKDETGKKTFLPL